MPFHASDSSILAPASTVVLGDTKEPAKVPPVCPTVLTDPVYVIDPPLGRNSWGPTAAARAAHHPVLAMPTTKAADG